MQSDLDKIKEILFGHEKKALDAITRRLETPESRTADVADVLADAISLSGSQSQRLERALRDPIEKTLTDAIHADPEKFADALFPVIGPAIRKAISEAMRSLVQSVNRAVDTSLSPTARYQAWRAGVPLGEWVLQRSLVYRVDEVYLIDPRTGLLIEHAHHPDTGDKDEDAVSAMLTAIQDFVRDSFSNDSSALDSASVGEFTVWLSHGPYAMLAAVIRGTPPNGVRNIFDTTVERLHLQHSQKLKAFQGGRLPGMADELEPCLQLQLREDAQRKRSGLPVSVILLLVALLAALAYFWYDGFRKDQQLEAWRGALEAQPGLVVTRVHRDGDVYHARGLRDPLAADPVALAAAHDIDAAHLNTDFRSFQSLDPRIIEARLTQVLDPPPGVTLSFANGTVSATGAAPAQWRARFELVGPAMAGVESIDAKGLTTADAELFARVMEVASPPHTIDLSVVDGVATMRGSAPRAWIDGVGNALAAVDGLRGSDLSGLMSLESIELQRLTMAIDGHTVRFLAGLTISDLQYLALQSVAAKMFDYARNARALGATPTFVLTGYTDASGSPEANRNLRTQRATIVRQWLIDRGVNGDWLVARAGPEALASQGANADLRSVRITVDSGTLNDKSAQ